MIANKIKPKIEKVINKFPTEVIIYRDIHNEFGEPSTNNEICTIKGFWHDGNSMISQLIGESGKVKRDKQNFLMVVYNEKSLLIEEGDYFICKGTKYEIVDKGNCNNMDIYFDMLLRRC